MRNTLFLLLFISFSINIFAQKSQLETYEAENVGYFITPVETPFGIVFTDNYASKIYLLINGKVEILVQSAGCGRYFSVSADGSYIGYKSINSDGKQAPAVYDLSAKTNTLLSDFSDLASLVSFANSGDFVFFKRDNSTLTCLKSNVKNKSQLSKIDYLQYSEISPISPDGKYFVYDIEQTQFFLYNFATSQKIDLPNDGKGVIYPKWSPDSKKILYQNHDMELFVYDIEDQQLYKIGKGGAGNWDANSELIVYQKTDADPINFTLNSSDIFLSDYKGQNIRQITFTKDVFEMTPSFDLQGGILYQTYDKRQIIRAKLNESKNSVISSKILLDNPKELKATFYDVNKFGSSKSITHLTNPVPYIHQKYDAPTGRNGGSACAATTSVMGLLYYNILPKWPVPATSYTYITGKNTSDYGGYVLDRYRYNEFTFDAYSSSKNAYGGYAYMWVSPYSSPGSGGMPKYQDHHGVTSNWFVWTSSATFAKTQTEINGQYPHPICSYITHSGHLTLAIGYVNGQHTLIFNDPWGDKNTPGYPSYDGDDAYYDWPGYNNGYQNLDPDGSHGTVAWTVKERGIETTYDPLHIKNIDYNHGFYINNSQNGSSQLYFRHVKDPAGSSGHIWWTGGEGGASSDVCYVTWTPNIPATANYKVEVYIPASFTDTYSSAAVTSSAYYKIYYNGGNTTVAVNQLANQGTWVDLGTYEFLTGQSGYVYLGDAVASADNGKKVLFDAVKFTQMSVAMQLDITNVTCKGANDGTATVTSAPGPEPHSYSWSHDAGNTTNTATNLAPGTYTVTVTDGNSDTYEETFTIDEADVALTLSTSSTNPSTVGGTNGEIVANISGGVEPYTISWSHDASNHTNTASNLSAGEYTVTVTDDYGCTLQETVWLYDPDCCTLLFSDFSTGIPSSWSNVVNSGGNPAYTWLTTNPGARVPGGNFDTHFAILDADYIYEQVGSGLADASLITRAIDCSGKNEVWLQFDHRFVYSSNTAVAKVEVSNDGTNWTQLESWSATSEGAVTKEYDISTYAANQSTVYIKWTYTEQIAYSNWWAIDNVEIYAPMSGTFTVKTDGTGDYGSLTDAINDINNCGIGTGGVTFLVQAGDIFEEQLPTITATGTSTKPIIFKTSDDSQTNPVIKSTGSTGTEAAVTIAGGDYITFDGIDVQISSGSALEYGFYLYNTSATDGAQHNTIKNCSITLNKSNTNSSGILQLIQTSINPTDPAGSNSYNIYQNITISNSYFGMQLNGYDVSGQDALYDYDCSVNSVIISDFGGSNLRSAGIIGWGQRNINIINNEISNGSTTLRTYGIYIAEYSTGNIYNNTIYNIYGTDFHVVGIRTYQADFNIFNNKVSDIEGIKMATGIEAYNGSVAIYNNFVYDIKAPSGNSVSNGYPSTRGISLRFTTGTQSVFYNSVYLAYYSSSSENESTCLYLESSSADLRNNIFENNTDATTGTRANVLYFKTAADLSNLSANTNNNCYYNGVATTKYALAYEAENALSYLDLAAYQVPSPNDLNSIEENPPFKSTTSPYDLHIDVTQTTNISNGGTPITGYTNDFDYDSRDASTPDIGADEYRTAGPLCGNYTIDNTSATAGTNFNNFTDAINALNDRGISCAVVFDVTSGQIFNENPPSIETTGTSTYTVTFQKSGTNANPVIKPTGTTADDDFGIHLDAVDYYTFDGIDIQIASGSDLEFGYYLTNSSPTDGAQHNVIKNCNIVLNNSNVNSCGIMQFVKTDIDPTSSDGANSFNTYDNISVENAFHGFKTFGYDVTGQEPLYDDATEIMNCSVNNFGYAGSGSRAVGILTWSQKNLSVHNNTITNGTTNYRTLGIYGAGNNTGNFYNNTVHGLYGTGAQVVGLRTYESNVDFYNNLVYDIEGVDMASGIEIYGGSADIYNNFVRDIRTPATSSYDYPSARGISNRAGDANIYNNSILLNYVSTGETNESAGIFVEGFSYDAASADIRNNLVVNKTNVSTGSVAAALYQSAEYSTISTNSDNNLYFAGTPSDKNLIYYNTANAYQTIETYKTYCSTYEQNSITEDAPFVSTSDLHIQPDVLTYIDGGGQVIGSITNDYDNDLRDLTNPDIGADEFECEFFVWRGTTDTDWNTATNWHKQQVPTATDNAVIPDVSQKSNNFPIITNAAEINDLTILSGANLQINPDFSLTVNGTMNNQAGTSGFIINSDPTGTGSFINSTSNVQATVERYLTGTQWHYLTSSVIDAPLSLFNTNNFYYYDETTSDSWSGGTFSGTMGWTTVTAPTLTSLQGYAYYYYESTLNFTGNLHTGTYTSPLLSWTNTTMADQFEGWHLLGNPYPSAIDWNSTGITFTNLDETVYYYDDDIDNYRYYNETSGGVNGGTQYIPAMQGFFVHTSVGNGQLELTNSARVHNTTDFYKKNVNSDLQTEYKSISLTTSDNNFTDETKILEISDALTNFDSKYDAYKMYPQLSDVPFIYTLNENEEFAINAIPEITEDLIIPLGFYAANEGIYNINLNTETIDLPVYLYDKQENVFQNLNENGVYSFAYSGGNETNRFEIRFKTLVDVNEIENDDIIIYPNPASTFVQVECRTLKVESYEIIDITGKTLQSNKNYGIFQKTKFDLSNYPSGVYYLKIQTENGVFVEKIIKN